MRVTLPCPMFECEGQVSLDVDEDGHMEAFQDSGCGHAAHVEDRSNLGDEYDDLMLAALLEADSRSQAKRDDAADLKRDLDA